MSSRAVRQWFRTEILTRVSDVEYKDTVNVVPSAKNLPDLWCTLEFSFASEERLSLGTRALFREYGTVQIIFLGLSGKGDDGVVSAAEEARAAFTGVSEELTVGAETGMLRIDAPEPPATDSTESGNWFLASVSCAYTFDVVRG